MAKVWDFEVMSKKFKMHKAAHELFYVIACWALQCRTAQKRCMGALCEKVCNMATIYSMEKIYLIE
jgi:hypothetical protein